MKKIELQKRDKENTHLLSMLSKTATAAIITLITILPRTNQQLIATIILGGPSSYKFINSGLYDLSLRDPLLSPNGMRQQYILGREIQALFPVIQEIPLQHLTAITDPTNNITQSARSFYRGLLYNRMSQKVTGINSPTSADAILDPPYAGYDLNITSEYAIPEAFYPDPVNSYDNDDFITMSDFSVKCSGAFQEMLKSRVMYSRKSYKLINKLKERVTSDLRVNATFNDLDAFETFYNVAIDFYLQNADFINNMNPQKLDLLRRATLINYYSQFSGDDKDGHKIFTTSLFSHLIKRIQTDIANVSIGNNTDGNGGQKSFEQILDLIQDPHLEKDPEGSKYPHFVSYHVDKQVFFALLNSYGLTNQQCNYDLIMDPNLVNNTCKKFPLPSSSFILNISKYDNQSKTAKIRAYYNGEEVSSCGDFTMAGRVGNATESFGEDFMSCDLDTFLKFVNSTLLSSEFDSLCRFGNETSLNAYKAMQLVVLLVLFLAFLVFLMSACLIREKRKKEILQFTKEIQERRMTRYHLGVIANSLQKKLKSR